MRVTLLEVGIFDLASRIWMTTGIAHERTRALVVRSRLAIEFAQAPMTIAMQVESRWRVDGSVRHFSWSIDLTVGVVRRGSIKVLWRSLRIWILSMWRKRW